MADSTTPQRPLVGWDKPDLDLTDADWQSGSQGRGDVQIAFVEGFIAMRNGGRPDSPSLIFDPGEWRAFVLGARDGDFDLT
ncbi:DUF397 domain-containing protein [Streptomyces sp. NBC_01387]|uniref:DUF397 domain-containing protein n=1 Tax=unclassified Streptomyces TaxID=2593676 RepID=UPI0020251127|nr:MULTISPECIES: DUF397 domain-containing protein [unclassified Streptomyces]MCX4552750.1 DUF397 domain-containing protein [Streptomyces sp. NBC_01500]WSC24088.1 DUF397 domain-containing protein [Streptomyces sp. NBC_01766]WSV57974.1 DUF397 domain-containing protein [Streptomyces sp. NBC_01014]